MDSHNNSKNDLFNNKDFKEAIEIYFGSKEVGNEAEEKDQTEFYSDRFKRKMNHLFRKHGVVEIPHPEVDNV